MEKEFEGQTWILKSRVEEIVQSRVSKVATRASAAEEKINTLQAELQAALDSTEAPLSALFDDSNVPEITRKNGWQADWAAERVAWREKEKELKGEAEALKKSLAQQQQESSSFGGQASSSLSVYLLMFLVCVS